MIAPVISDNSVMSTKMCDIAKLQHKVLHQQALNRYMLSVSLWPSPDANMAIILPTAHARPEGFPPSSDFPTYIGSSSPICQADLLRSLFRILTPISCSQSSASMR